MEKSLPVGLVGLRGGISREGVLEQGGGSGMWTYIKTFLKWVVFATVIGLVCGGVGTLFYFAVAKATLLRTTYGWLLYLLPAAGLVIVAMYRLAGMEKDEGTNLVLESVRTDRTPPGRMAPLIFVATVLTHLCGGSSGREGAALQIGGSVGSFVGKQIRLNQKDRQVMIMCGMAAVFSALFGTPLTATLFSMEVIGVGVLYYAALIPCLYSSLIAYGVAQWAGAAAVAFPLTGAPQDQLLPVIQVTGLAILCALVGILFCVSMHQLGKLYQRFLPNPYLRVAVGALLVIGVTLLSGTRDYNGAGTEVIALAMAGQAVPWAFTMKILMTALTLGAGFKGGEIVPAFFVGATFGCVAAPLLGLSGSFGAAIGLVAVFCSVVNCPLASLMLSMELFGGGHLVLFAVACAVSYLFSGPYGLYHSQKLVYSKLSPTYVNADTK